MAPAASTLDLVEGAPERYVVVPGDTLWSIAKRFLKNPWKWADLWKMNQDQVSNPNRIRPGDVLVLDRTAEQMRLKLQAVETVKLSPQIRSAPLPPEPVLAIPTADIEPFLSKPLVIAQNELAMAPRIVRTQENRVALGAGDIAYVQGITKDKGGYWQIFRPGAALTDPETNETLGYEAIYLGDAMVSSYGDVSTVNIVASLLDIYAGDYLLPAPRDIELARYIPHSPSRKIDARIIAAYGSLYETGDNSIVAISKGARDGLEVGHVLALYRNLNSSVYQMRESALWGRAGLIYDAKNPKTNYVNEPLRTRDSPLWGRTGPMAYKHKNDQASLPSPPLPDERYGLMMIFRVFERASYALIMNASRPVSLVDIATNP